MTCTRSMIPRIALAIALGIAAIAFAPTGVDAGHSTLASAFPIAQAQFAH